MDEDVRSDHKYTMRISRLAIDKLGIRLYDRVSAVLAELIANSYDADTSEVAVWLPWGVTLAGTARGAQEAPYEIVVTDNGHGMTADEVNEHYLMVGSDRRIRTGSDLSRERSRPVMGRKGIGKLAAFGICRTIEVISAGSGERDRTEAGWPVSHIILDLDDMVHDTESDYYPSVGPLDGIAAPQRGTTEAGGDRAGRQAVWRIGDRRRANPGGQQGPRRARGSGTCGKHCAPGIVARAATQSARYLAADRRGLRSAPGRRRGAVRTRPRGGDLLPRADRGGASRGGGQAARAHRRAINYLYALDTFLTENPRIGDQFPRRRRTFIVDHIDSLRPASLSSLDSDARIDRRTWRELLDSTLRAHRDFLERVYAMRGLEEERAQAG
ncbi:ATP-binding protein [Nocardia vaccinii]|uniref:ATP-binding protein n=1 Tax=Nocardia vaccinii TaxID=1822 RepID=UPI0008340295|nr:ATP-binding protein [Nocardia vaccinii]